MNRHYILLLTSVLLSSCKQDAATSDAGTSRAKAQGAPAGAFAVTSPSMESNGIAADAMMSAQVTERAPIAPGTATESWKRGRPEDPATTGQALSGSMLIRTGQAQIEVREVAEGVEKIRALAKNLGGYIANSSVSGGGQQAKSATLEIKLPAIRFEEAIGGLGQIGKVENVNSTTEDVGEEYADLEARETNSKRLESRLIDLLATRTGKLEEVLAVERELARVREDIERMAGRMRYLKTRSAISTLTVTVHEKQPVVGNAPGEHPLRNAVRQAWRNFIMLVASIIASLGLVIPASLVAWGIYKAARKKRK